MLLKHILPFVTPDSSIIQHDNVSLVSFNIIENTKCWRTCKDICMAKQLCNAFEYNGTSCKTSEHVILLNDDHSVGGSVYSKVTTLKITALHKFSGDDELGEIYEYE